MSCPAQEACVSCLYISLHLGIICLGECRLIKLVLYELTDKLFIINIRKINQGKDKYYYIQINISEQERSNIKLRVIARKIIRATLLCYIGVVCVVCYVV